MEQTRIPERYKLLEEVGQGGMAVVYRAEDCTLKREVAIKVLHHHLASEPESKARLEREAQAVAKLRHENILEIFDYSGIASESAYIVTEFIDGKTLKQILAERPIRHPEVAALIVAQVGGALAHAHSLGIIHRDVKPENVMIRNDGLLKLMDFGIAQVVDLQRMTVTGQLLGSPAYMAPELIEGGPLDFRTDVFSVGIMLYQLATGTLPFTGKNPHEVLRRISEGRFPDPRGANRLIGEALVRIMRRALARNPDDRYPDVSQLVDELQEHLAEGGLADARTELGSFFADPEAYEATLPDRLRAALMASARAQLAAGKTARALESWNRILAFDPANGAVLAALRRLEGRTRVKQFALLGAGAAALAVMIVAIARMQPEAATPGLVEPGVSGVAPPAPAPAPLAVPSPAAAASPSPSPPPSPSGRSPSPPPAAGRSPGGAAARAPKAPAATVAAAPRPAVSPPVEPGGSARDPSGPAARTFTLGPTPQNVDVYLDGEKQFAYGTDHKSISVPWQGNHVIEFRSPSGCCFVEKIEVGPDRPLPPENTIARKLKWRPARLVITTEPELPRARIMIKDPSRSGAGNLAKPGEEVHVIFYPTDEPVKEVEVALDSGEIFTSERVTVRAGQRSSHVVKVKTGN
jgi:serine/threonine-protein kinase